MQVTSYHSKSRNIWFIDVYTKIDLYKLEVFIKSCNVYKNVWIIVILELLENYVDNYFMSALCIMDLHTDNIVYISSYSCKNKYLAVLILAMTKNLAVSYSFRVDIAPSIWRSLYIREKHLYNTKLLDIFNPHWYIFLS